MRAANIVSVLISALWFALFVMGRNLMHEAYLQKIGKFPSLQQVGYYIICPLLAVALTLLSSWVGNVWGKPIIALVSALVIGFAIFLFCLDTPAECDD